MRRSRAVLWAKMQVGQVRAWMGGWVQREGVVVGDIVGGMSMVVVVGVEDSCFGVGG